MDYPINTPDSNHNNNNDTSLNANKENPDKPIDKPPTTPSHKYVVPITTEVNSTTTTQSASIEITEANKLVKEQTNPLENNINTTTPKSYIEHPQPNSINKIVNSIDTPPQVNVTIQSKPGLPR